MSRMLRRQLLLGLTLLTAACADAGGGAATTGAAPPAGVTSIAGELSRGYELLSQYDSFVIGNHAAAARFHDKATQALAGTLPEPEAALADNPETARSRMLLLGARKNIAGGKNATAFAEAQVNYDCWVARLPLHDDTAAYCQARFYQALATMGVSGERHFAVYFDAGSAVPNTEAFATIRQAAAAFTESADWRIHLTGHAGSEKTAQANTLLSMRRAVAVRNALEQNGVDAAQVVIGAVGSLGLQAKGKKGQSREDQPVGSRVDIAIVETDKDQPDAGPDIKKIVPQYFGHSEPRF